MKWNYISAKRLSTASLPGWVCRLHLYTLINVFAMLLHLFASRIE